MRESRTRETETATRWGTVAIAMLTQQENSVAVKRDDLSAAH